jgi:hypothetical protein
VVWTCLASLLWVKPHLTDRVQSVDVGRTLSDAKEINGSLGDTTVLGPLLFVVVALPK